MLESLGSKLGHDKVRHLKGGALLAVGVLATLAVGQHVGWGFAVGAASIVMGWGVERYQAIRREGEPSRADMVATAAPGVILGVVMELLARFVV